MVLFCPLASGSKGNAYLVKTKETTLLVDCGLSAKSLQARLSFLGISLSEIDAILITHEHKDHIQGLKVLGKTAVPVFTNKETAKGIYSALYIKPKLKIFSTHEEFLFRDITVFPFSVQHDTLDPVGVVLQVEGKKIGICTDLGTSSSFLETKLSSLSLLVIEANHDVRKVQEAKRPLVYKRRVLSNIGHLSNEQCALFLSRLQKKNLQAVYLSHLSQECNEPELALQVVLESNPALSGKLLIAYQEKHSEVITL